MNTPFLDSNQYTPQGINDYESIWGTGFVSPGGAKTARDFLEKLELPPGSLILDVGCGLGGSAFLMAAEFGFQVEGLDLSRNMLEIARARCSDLGLESRVLLQHGDILQLSVQERYDAIYSRDAFLHIAAKKRLFQNLYAALRPGGILFFTDYCCSPRPWSDGFSQYVEKHRYSLHTLSEYEALLKDVGFLDIEISDLSQQFLSTLNDDLFVLSQSEGDPMLIEAWQKKLSRASRGEQKWGAFKARRCPPS